jgi:putative transposase
MSAAFYPSELNDQEWACLSPLLPPAKPGGRPRTVSLWMILNGIFYVLRSGCQWRMLSREYGPWTTERGGPHGYDGAKKLSGRKRHLLVDTLGLLLKVVVHPADLQDREGAR